MEARKAAIEMVGSSPCLEGLLLSILGKRPPEKSDACKKLIKQLLDLDLTERTSYGIRRSSFSRKVSAINGRFSASATSASTSKCG